MRITREKPNPRPELRQNWHVLTVGESGFSMLDIYARMQRGLEIEVIREFVMQVNKKDESGTLHPAAPVSAIPNRFFRDLVSSVDPTVLGDFKRHVAEFLESNRHTIRAENILVDFRVSAAPVPLQYIEATEEVFRREGHESPVKQLIIFT